MVTLQSVQGHTGLPTIFNFWHSGALVLRTERQSARMSKIKNSGSDQYGTEHFGRLILPQSEKNVGMKGLKTLKASIARVWVAGKTIRSSHVPSWIRAPTFSLLLQPRPAKSPFSRVFNNMVYRYVTTYKCVRFGGRSISPRVSTWEQRRKKVVVHCRCSWLLMWRSRDNGNTSTTLSLQYWAPTKSHSFTSSINSNSSNFCTMP